MSAHTTDHTPLDPGSPHGRGAAARPDRRTERRLWFSILAAPIAWAVAELASYALVGRVCRPASATAALDTWQWVAVFGIPLLCALVALAALLTALGVFRRWTGPVKVTRAEGWNRVEFMALFGGIVSLLLLLNIIYFGVLPAIVEPCLRVT